MEYSVGDVSVHYVKRGEGFPLLALHGAGVDHRELMASLDPAFDDVAGYRRIYLDLPGMGRTPAPDTITSADDVLDVLLGFIDGVVGEDQLAIAGHSAGAYYAQALARQRPEQVSGLALLCPLLTGIHDVPDHQVVHRSGDIGNAEFRDYFTVQTPEMFDLYEQYTEPAAHLADQSALARIGQRWEFADPPEQRAPYEQPTLFVTGRQDSTVGYARAWELLGQYPRATFAVLDRAGHALPHEQPELLHALVTEWLGRVRERMRQGPAR